MKVEKANSDKTRETNKFEQPICNSSARALCCIIQLELKCKLLEKISGDGEKEIHFPLYFLHIFFITYFWV